MAAPTSGIRGALADHLLTDLYTYVSVGMGYTLYEQPHREMCEFLEGLLPPPPDRMKHARQTKGMLLAPRETLKTSIAQGLAEYFILKWKRLYNYDVRVLLIRSNREAAKEVLGAIAQDLGTNNPVLQQAFGSLGPSGSVVWSADSITMNWRDTNYREPTVSTGGVESPQTGMHVDLVIADDLANETNYNSERDMVRARMKLKSLEPIMNRWGSLILVGTRWGHNDPAAYVLDLNASLEEHGKPPAWRTLIRGVYLEDGSLYYPDHLSEAVIEQKRSSLSTDTKLFTAWYLNQVISDESKVFKPEFLRFYDAESVYEPDDDEPATLTVKGGAFDGARRAVRCTIHIDPAATVGTDSNYTAIIVAMTSEESDYFIHESWKGKEVNSAVIARITALADLYRPEEISIDVLGQQVLWLDPLRDSLKKAGVVTRLTSYKGLTHDEKVGKGILGKAKRIEALEPLFREGKIFFRRGYNTALIHEYNHYDGPTHRNHFDALDALAHIRTMTKPPRVLDYRDDLERLEMLEFEDDGPAERKKVPGTWAGR